MLNDWKDSHISFYGLEKRSHMEKRSTRFAGEENETNTHGEWTVYKQFVNMKRTA